MKKKYEDLPLSLALFDAVPVLLFSASMLLVGSRWKNLLFIIGACLCVLGGLGKVTWKMIIACTKKDIAPLNKQMRIMMPAGFLLIIMSLITGLTGADAAALWATIASFPAVIFFLIAFLGMAAMGVCAKKLDSTKQRSHWIEQTVNTVAQLGLLIGILVG